MTTAIRREAPNHNTLTCYTVYNCRLPDCVERKRLWQREARRKQREGAWRPFVDAAPVRQHLLALREQGIVPNRVAAVAGVDEANLRTIVPTAASKRRPARHLVRTEIAEKVLAVTAEAARAYTIDGTGTRRRIQALAAMGWPFCQAGDHIGLSGQYVGDLVRRTEDQRLVRADTADQVAAGYEKLRRQRPARHGVKPHIIRNTRRHAAEQRWPTPRYWDQFPDAINDPHFTPEYGITKAELLADETRWLIETAGLTRAEAAQRLGKDLSYIYRVLGMNDGAAA
ncbi:hypothetical protein ACFYPA_06440 [Streptomyces sp. NPDC005775]|uniref:hypothetical protein n=1 Tax=Streptomyces sp. NPDC005775 TaxID=3364729 RepID=UPI003681EB3A